MKKQRKSQRSKPVDPVKAMRRVARQRELENGGRPRSVVFTDRKKAAAKKACRGKVAW